MSRDYVIEKLTTALDCLATHPGDARHRLIAAWGSLHKLDVADFPDEYKKDWQWVVGELTKYGPLVRCDGMLIRGTVENTMPRRKNKTASRIATKIYELYWQLSENTQYR